MRSATRGSLLRRTPFSASPAAAAFRTPGSASRLYALGTDGRNITGGLRITARRQGPLGSVMADNRGQRTYLRKEDAVEIENRFLKPLTPGGKDPWLYNSTILPPFKGMIGDAGLQFNFRVPEKLLEAFLKRMTYPNELGHLPMTSNAPEPYRNRPTYHWADEDVFGMPPVAVVRVHNYSDRTTAVNVVAEVHWWRRTIRVLEFKQVLLRTDEEDESALGELEEDDFELQKQAAEYPIPPNWLYAMKKLKWPAPLSQEAMIPYSEFTQEDQYQGHHDDDDMEEEKKFELLQPLKSEPFAHPQHDMLGRSYWMEDAEEEEDEEREDAIDNASLLRAEHDDDDEEEGETIENERDAEEDLKDLVAGNPFLRPSDVWEELDDPLPRW